MQDKDFKRKYPSESRRTPVISETTGQQKWHQKEVGVDDAQINFFKTAEKAMSTPGVLTNEVETPYLVNTFLQSWISCQQKTNALQDTKLEIYCLTFKQEPNSPTFRTHGYVNIPNPITSVNTIKLNSRCLYHRVLQIYYLLILVAITIPNLHTVT